MFQSYLKLLRRTAGTCLCACLAGGSPAFAAESEKEGLEEIVVTAGLTPLALGDIASSVTIIDRQYIEQRQARYLAELLRDVPGFSVSQAGGPGAQTQIRVRGAEANQLLVLMDGVRANDPALGDEFQYQYALTSDIERIEIIRGPQSATWGTDAMAGVVNIIRRAQRAGRRFGASAEVGSFDTLNLGADGGYSKDGLRVHGGVSRYRTDGINIARQGAERDGSANTTANAGLEWDAGDALSLSLSGQFVDARSDFDAIDFIVTGLPTDADRRTESEQAYARAALRVAPPDSRWNGRLSVNWRDSSHDNFSDGSLNSGTASDSLEIRLRTSVELGEPGSGSHVLSLAADRQDVSFSQRGLATPFGDPNQDQSYDITGLAAEYVGKALDRLSWSLSARRDSYSDFDDASSWRAALSWAFNDAWRLRAALGTGSKAPTFTERFGFFSDLFIGNPELKPESSTSWEIGLETRWADDRYTLSVAYFDQNLEDEINGFVFDPASGLFTARNRETESERRGVEAVVSARVTDALTVNANYAYVDATEAGPLGGTVREVRRPKHTGNLNVDYRFAAGRGNLNANVSYNGAQLDDFFSPVTFVAERVRLDAYTLVNIAASWRWTRNLELTARIENLLDEEYEEVIGFRSPGRAVYAGMRLHYGS